jgi:RecG-like helicase
MFIGKDNNKNYAIRINNVNDHFFTLPFGRQIEDRKKISNFKKEAKKENISCKGKATLTAVRKWIKENKPAQFFASWQSDSSYYKDDVVEIYVKEQ